jgi:2-C-methyl-D-erythritol 4-phosphate cytidylyltransferase
MSAPAIVALIPAAGVGARAGGEIPKQYQTIAGAAMIVHTIRALKKVSRIAEMIVVVSPDDAFADDLIPVDAQVKIVRLGGATRAETVRNGLSNLRRRYEERDWVLVHDAARCCVPPARIDALIDACYAHEVGGLLALPVADTIKRVGSDDATVAETIDRRALWQAQTPQMFRLGMLQDALAFANLAQITDEASAMEKAGFAPQIVLGASRNLKVTFPDDFLIAQALLHDQGRA